MIINSILTKVGLFIAAIAIAILSILWVYNRGYDAAVVEYEKKILEEELKWKNKIDELNITTEKIFLAYKTQKEENEKILKAKREELIKYVEKDPSFNSIIFDNDILRKLNGD